MSCALDNIRVVLVSPIYGGNIGAVCRCMMNCGISDLAVAAPRDDVDENETVQRAYHAVEVYRKRRVFSTLEEAVADCGAIAGTSARRGLYRSHAKSPREWAPGLLKSAQGGRVALVFGPEDKGLSNDHLALCTHIIQIPSHSSYVSLNLSHAVMICCYELFMESGIFDDPAEEWSPDAPSQLRERMLGMWEKTLYDIGFMNDEKGDHMMMGLRRIFSRGQLTVNDVKILMGIARQTQWFVNRQRALKGDGSAPPAEEVQDED